ncbi:hypothetical protein D3C72_1924250 [compost metagenome]
MASADVGKLFGGVSSFDEMQKSGKLKITGRGAAVNDILASLDSFPSTFNLVTPMEEKAPASKPMASNVEEL